MRWYQRTQSFPCTVPSTPFLGTGQQIPFALLARYVMDPLGPRSLGQGRSDLSGALVPPETCCHFLLMPSAGEPQLVHHGIHSGRLSLFCFSNVVPPTGCSTNRKCGFFSVIPSVLVDDEQDQGHEVRFFIHFHLFLEILRSQFSICALKRKCGAHSHPSREVVR